MRGTGQGSLAAVFSAALMLGGCIGYPVIPEGYVQQADRSLTFAELKRNPEGYKGRVVVLGGAVLKAEAKKEGTLIEVLHLPLGGSDRPVGYPEASEGRYLVLDPDHTDPVVLQNRRVTLVAEVLGQKTQAIDEFDYVFPYLKARYIHVWAVAYGYAYPPPYPYYYPGPYSYWYPYGYPYGYPYWYYPPPVIVEPSPSAPPRGRFESDAPAPAPAPSDKPKRRF